MNIDLFKERLMETAAWCLACYDEAAIARSLRTPPQPDEELGPVGSDAFEQHFKAVAQKRVDAFLFRPFLHDNPMAGGRLMIAFAQPEAKTVSEASQGFIDQHGLPPWDSWVYWDRLDDDTPYLICWLPSEAAAVVTPILSEVAHIDWLDETQSPVWTDLKSSGVMTSD